MKTWCWSSYWIRSLVSCIRKHGFVGLATVPKSLLAVTNDGKCHCIPNALSNVPEGFTSSDAGMHDRAVSAPTNSFQIVSSISSLTSFPSISMPVEASIGTLAKKKSSSRRIARWPLHRVDSGTSEGLCSCQKYAGDGWSRSLAELRSG